MLDIYYNSIRLYKTTGSFNITLEEQVYSSLLSYNYSLKNI